MEKYKNQVIKLLTDLVKLPSISGEEDKTADLLEKYFLNKHIPVSRIKNNIIVRNKRFDERKPSLLLNSHHDTVKPAKGYSNDPFMPVFEEDRIIGLGTNDAGASLVSLIFAFLEFYFSENLPFNIILIASAEEEISGVNGITCALSELEDVQFMYGIVGEPTEMRAAVAEKGLMVLDCYTKGKASHAARDTGINAIYESIADIEWFKNYRLPVTSEYLGEVKMSVTQVQAGTQHNVIPEKVHFVVDIRSTDSYSNQELLNIINQNIGSEVVPRSTRLNPSFLSSDTALFQALKDLKIPMFGSPTLSDQALIPFPTCKIGPGTSERSHTADEYVIISEIVEGMKGYSTIIRKLIENELKVKSNETLE